MKPGDLVIVDDWENEKSIFLSSYFSKTPSVIKWYNGEIGLILDIRDCQNNKKMKVAKILISEGIGEIFSDYIKIV